MADSATPQTVAHQAPLSMELPRQEYWSPSTCLMHLTWAGEGGLGWGIHVYPWLIHVNV